MGHVGDKASPGALGIGQGIGHIVEREGQLSQLVGAGHRHPHRKVPAAKAPGSGAHLAQGLHQPVGKGAHHHKGDAQGCRSCHQEHLHGLPLEGADRGCAGGGKHHSHTLLSIPSVQGHSDDVGRRGIQSIKGVASLIHALGGQSHRLLGHRFGGLHLAVGIVTQEDVALQVCDEDISVNAGGEGVDKPFEHRGLQLIGLLVGLGQKYAGHARNGFGIFCQQLFFLTAPILAEKEHHHHTQHNKAEHHNDHGDAQVPGEEALLNGNPPSAGAVHSLTSNL